MYQTDHDKRPTMMGKPVITFTTTKASTLLVSMYRRTALRNKK